MWRLSPSEVLRMLYRRVRFLNKKSRRGGEEGEDSVHPTLLAGGGGGWPQAALSGEDFAVRLQGLHGKNRRYL
jgi:hypothetical protein